MFLNHQQWWNFLLTEFIYISSITYDDGESHDPKATLCGGGWYKFPSSSTSK